MNRNAAFHKTIHLVCLHNRLEILGHETALYSPGNITLTHVHIAVHVSVKYIKADCGASSWRHIMSHNFNWEPSASKKKSFLINLLIENVLLFTKYI